MMENIQQDLELAHNMVAGSQSALKQFFETYADDLYAFICHLLGGNRQDTEDIWQETLLAALKSMPSYRGDSRLFTWLCAIARFKVAGHLRHHRLSMSDNGAEVSLEQVEQMLDSAPLPEAVMFNREVRARVVETLQFLPQEYRTALTARYIEEKSVEEIAWLLGKSYKASESLLARARTSFKEIFNNSGDKVNV